MNKKPPLQNQRFKWWEHVTVHNSYQHLILPYMELYDIDKKELESEFFTAKSHEIDGKIYYIDFGVMTGAIYYNKDMWKAAGLTEDDIPKTWDEFREVAKKLTITKNGKMVQTRLQDTYLSLILPVMVSGFGIFMMKQDIAGIFQKRFVAGVATGSVKG